MSEVEPELSLRGALGKRPPLAILLAWPLASILAAVCGIGGGIFLVPLLHYVGRMPLRLAVGTSLVTMFALGGTATVRELFHEGGAFNPVLTLALVVGGFVGACLGYPVAQRLKPRALKAVFAVVLLAAAARMVLMESGAGDPRALLELSLTDAALVVLIGLAGGFVAPLLGIGGGLIAIPALFFTFHELDYLEVRAAAIALTVVTSLRSGLLYWRAGEVHLPTAAWLAVISAGAALVAVALVHLPGGAEAARILVAAILFFVALRFGWDVRRPDGRRGEPSARGPQA